jgi:uncharacterized membrane protein YbhN (UPF0104 family)
VAGAALLLYFGLASWSEPGRVAAVLRRFPAGAAAAACGLVLAGLALRALRWHLYTRVLGLGVPAGPSVLAFLAGFAFTATPGKVGEVVKSFLLKRRFGVPVSRTAASLVVERVTDLLAMLMLAVIGLAGGALSSTADAGASTAPASGDAGLSGGSVWLLGASAVILALALVLLMSPALQRLVLAPLQRVPGLRRIALALPSLLESSGRLLTPLPLVAGLALALGGWSCEALALDRILGALDAAVPLPAAFFAFASSSLLGVLSMLPGGLGGFEATMVVFLRRLAVDASTAVAATLLFRLATLWLVSVLGLLVLGGWVLAYGRGERPLDDRAAAAGGSSGSR